MGAKTEVRFIIKGITENTKERINNMLLWCRVKREDSVFLAPSEYEFQSFIAQLPYTVTVERLEEVKA